MNATTTSCETPDPRDRDVLIVGASAAGLSTAEALRRKGHRGRLTLLDSDPDFPYERPPLSKQLLSRVWGTDQVRLRDSPTLDALNAEFLLGESAAHLDLSRRTVITSTGRSISADAIVLATGVRARNQLVPRSNAASEAPEGVYTLRTLGDSLRLREALPITKKLVVVGNGVLGSEVSATARTLGIDVTMVGPAANPMTRQLGPLGSRLLAELHHSRGVQLLGGRRVTALKYRSGCVRGVELDSGQVVPADAVVVATGSETATDWLSGSGLELDDGIICDPCCRAAEGVWAAGDVARWHHARLGKLVRLENRTNAAEQAMAVALDVLGEGHPYTPLPYFWTDQFNVRVQVHGLIPPTAAFEVTDGDPATGRFVATAFDNGQMVGVLGWAMPKQTRLRRQELMAATNPSLVSPL